MPEPGEEHPPHGPPRPPPRIANGKPNPFFAPHREHIQKLRAEFAAGMPEGKLLQRNITAAEIEWVSLPDHVRVLLLSLAGFDDADQARNKQWRELPPPERQTISFCIRELQVHLRLAFALTL